MIIFLLSFYSVHTQVRDRFNKIISFLSSRFLGRVREVARGFFITVVLVVFHYGISSSALRLLIISHPVMQCNGGAP